jgi:hypothetical protein
LPRLLAGKIEIRGRIGWHRSSTAQPREKAANAPEARDLGIHHQAFARPGRTVLVEVALITLNVGACKRGGITRIVAARPLEKAFERPMVRLNGSLRIRTGGELAKE